MENTANRRKGKAKMTTDELAILLQTHNGKLVKFNYYPPEDCQDRKLTPSALAERARTIAKAPYEQVVAFIGNGDEKSTPWLTKAGKWCITLYTTRRQDIDTREYKPRCYRLDGIAQETIKINNGSRGLEPVAVPVAQEQPAFAVVI
jgi:hypothetical protein